MLAPMQQERPKIYGVGDFNTIRSEIFEDTIEAVKNRFPIENDRFRLTLEDLAYSDIPTYTKRQQKEAVQTDRSLAAKLRGKWVLQDKTTGEVVSKSGLKTIMDVPYMTERGTFIRNGTDMTLPIQMRLVPGVYTRVADNGEAKAHVNVKPGTGSAMFVTMDPKKPVFKITQGTRHYKLYPLLKHSGISDEQLIAAWGKDIYKANYDDFVSGGGWYSAKNASEENPYDEIVKKVFAGELDEDSTEFTLGGRYKKVDPDLMLATSTKLLKVTRGDEPADNRDSLENQRFYMAPDLISERIRLDAGRLAQNLLWKLSRTADANKIPAGAFNRYINGLFTESKLAQAIEETNPLDAYLRSTKVTRMGEGGISSTDTAPMSSRLVHNTYKGFIDPVISVESLRVGLDSGIAMNAQKGRDGLMYVPMINNVSGRKVLVNSLEASKVPISFPEYVKSDDKYIPAMVGNNIEYLPRSQVKYFIPNGDSLFGMSSNFIPLKSGIKAGRLLMAQKHQSQAVSLKSRMSPYVQTRAPDDSGDSTEKKAGAMMGAVFADDDGRVLSSDSDSVTVLHQDGTKHTYSLYNNFPMNRKSLLSNELKVQPGTMVKKGQLLASSNYTDENGVSALGTQMRVAWMPYKGENYLDAIVVSESAANKLTSEHMYHTGVEKSPSVNISKHGFAAAFPSKFNKDQLSTVDRTGTVKPGTVLKVGDPMVLAYQNRKASPGSLHRELAKDTSVTWEHDFPGYVTDVVDGPAGVKVYTKAYLPLQTGDKLAARFANKGVSARIVPDAEMPVDASGDPLEVIFGPTGIVSRVNSAALVEAVLGKVAAKTGKRYVLPGFMDESLVDFAKRELDQAGISDREDVTDPTTGVKIPGVLVGNSYVVKMHHTAESKGGARSTGGYTADEQPATGGHEGAKVLGNLVLGAITAHGVSDLLKDFKLIHGQKNTDFWRDFRMGKTPTMPKTPLIYDKFLASLEGAGIHVHKDKNRTNIFALTQKDIDTFAKAEVKTSDTYGNQTLQPLKGGLFDPDIFGPDGNQWGYINLDEPVLNPVMEDPIKNLLGVTEAGLEDIIAGRKELPNGKTGGDGLYMALKGVDVDKEIQNALHEVKNTTRSRRDKAIKKLRYLSAMKKHGAHPSDFMLTKIPVIPPMFRRITQSGDLTMVADANYLYRALLDKKNDVREALQEGLPGDVVGSGKLGVYKAFRAITGLSDPDDQKLKEKKVSGLLKWVFGNSSPKLGNYQRNVVGGKLDLAGRNVVVANSALRLDEVGIPKKQAWDLYKDFVIRKLAQRGMDPLTATKEVLNRTDTALGALKQVLQDRPLILTRPPALHKYSVAAFNPLLVEGDTLQVNPVIQKPFNLDADGDAMTYYVPVSEQAVKNARERMMPSKNLLGARFFNAHYLPQEEYILGAWLASRPGNGAVKNTFKTKQEALNAYKQGLIDLNDNIQIEED